MTDVTITEFDSVFIYDKVLGYSFSLRNVWKIVKYNYSGERENGRFQIELHKDRGSNKVEEIDFKIKEQRDNLFNYIQNIIKPYEVDSNITPLKL